MPCLVVPVNDVEHMHARAPCFTWSVNKKEQKWHRHKSLAVRAEWDEESDYEIFPVKHTACDCRALT